MLQTVMSRFALVAFTCALSFSAYAMADGAKHAIHVPSGDLGSALELLAKQSGSDLVYRPDQVQQFQTGGVEGELSTEEAVMRLLAGTPLILSVDSTGAMLIALPTPPPASETPPPATSASDPADSTLADVIVTGSRIRGVAPSSPVVEVSARDIRNSGLVSVGDVVRSLPQNFSGGQNPGAIAGASGRSLANQNLNGGSSINLRGLGPDATLTLLNGRRLSYDGIAQAVDVSSIPLLAIDRLQIVTDGASAIYGSDAVAGVANIILKRDMDGVDTLARYGAATEGGYQQTQLSTAGGHVWESGGLIAALNFERVGDVDAGQRGFTRNVDPRSDLLPQSRQVNGLVSVHQEINDSVVVSLLSLYSDRTERQSIAYPTNSYSNAPKAKQYTISPAVDVQLGGDWTANAYGVIGHDETRISQKTFSPTGDLLSAVGGCYCNSSKQIEAGAEGPVFMAPGGDARVALGAGYRRAEFSSSSVAGDRESTYGFAELNVPLASPEQNVSGVHRLSLNGAARYERYPDLGDVVTPKIGVVYAPVADVELKGSWGKSFKAPTLLQQNQASYVAVFPASSFGGSSAPNAQALLRGGGNLNLDPEKAKTLAAGVTYSPAAVAGLRLEANWFQVDYQDRVVEPVATFGQAFTNPIYAPYVTYAPSAAQQQAIISVAKPFYSLGPVYDPNDVVAIVDNAYSNATRQKVQGIDVAGRYSVPLASGSLEIDTSGSWLKTRQETLIGQPYVDLAGTVYNPAKFRGRGGVAWVSSRWTLSGYVNYQSALTNPNVVPAEHVDSFTTVDAALRYQTPSEGSFGGLELALAAQNIFDTGPPYVTPQLSYTAPYDSLNHSAVGRFISVALTKNW